MASVVDKGVAVLAVASYNDNTAINAFDLFSGKSWGQILNGFAPDNVILDINSIVQITANPLNYFIISSDSGLLTVQYGYGGQLAINSFVLPQSGGWNGAIGENALVCDGTYLYALGINRNIYRYVLASGAPSGIVGDPTNALFIAAGTGGLGEGGDPEMRGMALGPDGNLYVVDGSNVLSFGASEANTGAYLSGFAIEGMFPYTVAFDQNPGNMYVIGFIQDQGSIQRFAGTTSTPLGANGSTQDPTIVPLGPSLGRAMAIQSNFETGGQRLYVSTYGTNPDGSLDVGSMGILVFDGNTGDLLSTLVPATQSIAQITSMTLAVTLTPDYQVPQGPDTLQPPGGFGMFFEFLNAIWQRIRRLLG